MTTVTADATRETATTRTESTTAVNKLIGAFIAIAIIGWGAASLLTAVHFWALPLPDGAQPQGSMEVITSSWAYVGPIPLATVGALYYVMMITLGATWLVTKHELLERVMLPVTALGVLSSIGLVYLQLGPIGAICPFCMVSATATVLLFTIELVIRSKGGAGIAPRGDATRVWPITFVSAMLMTMVVMYTISVLPIPGN